MKRFHIYSDVCSIKLKDTYNRINHELGVESIDIDLDSLGSKYRDESSVLNIIRGERPTWVWFNNCNALLNTSLAGWLRNGPQWLDT